MHTKKVKLLPNQTLKKYLAKNDHSRQLSLVITNEKSAFRYNEVSWNSKTDSLKITSMDRSSESYKISASPPRTKQYFQRIFQKVRNQPIHYDGLYLDKDCSEDISDPFEKSSDSIRSVIMKPILSSSYSKPSPSYKPYKPKCVTSSVEKSHPLPSLTPSPPSKSERVNIINHQDCYLNHKNLRYDHIYDREFLRNLNRKRVLYQRLEEPFQHYKERAVMSQTPDIFLTSKTPDIFLTSKTPDPEVRYISQLKQNSFENQREVVYQKARNSQKLSRPRVRIIIPKVMSDFKTDSTIKEIRYIK